MNSKSFQKLHLNLEKSSTKAKRNLVLFQNCLFAYGGENGLISVLRLPFNNEAVNDKSSSLASSLSSSFKVIHSFDEPVRALAFSSDGQRVAVGLDDGVIEIYEFTAHELQSSSPYHPFSGPSLSSKNACNDSRLFAGSSDDDVNGQDILASQQDDLFATQDDIMEHADGGTNGLSSGLLSPSFRLPHRFDSPIRSLDFCPIVNSNHYFIAISTESSPGLTIANVTSLDAFEKYLDSEASSIYDHHGVRNAVYSPDGNHVVSLGCNGMLCLWNVPVSGDRELDWELVHSDSHLVVSQQDTGAFATSKDKSMVPVWSTDGSLLAIPGEKDLQLRRKRQESQGQGGGVKEWFAKDLLVWKQNGNNGNTGNADDDVIVGIAVDPRNEGYVVTSSLNGAIGLWKVDLDAKNDEPQGRFLGNILHTESLCTHLLWKKEESSEILFLALDNGYVQLIDGRDSILEKSFIQEKTKRVNVNEQNEQEENEAETQEAEFDTQPIALRPVTMERKRLKKPVENDQEAYDSNDDNSIFEKDTSNMAKNSFVMDEADEVDDEDMEHNERTESNSVGSRLDYDDVLRNKDNSHSQSDGHDDENLDKDQFDANGDDEDYDIDEEGIIGSNRIAEIPEAQAPFAPSSTPLATRRILCWNQNGVITSRERQDVSGVRTIDFTFTDSATKRPISFRDPYNFIIGSFGEEGGLFASDLMEEVDEDDIDVGDVLNGMSASTRAIVKKSGRRNSSSRSDRATGSNIYFHRFETFASLGDKDWTLALPEGELVLGCATGFGWNAVVTNRRFLRLFSTSGLQGPVIWLKGNPVTIVGRGRLCAAIFHEGNPLIDGTQRLGYCLYEGVSGKLIAEGSISAISPRSSLVWAGFNCDLSLCVMDEDGMLSMLAVSKIDGVVESSYKWIPVLDTLGLKKSPEDEFWPVAIQEGKFICVPLKGVKHPDPVRRPLTTSFPLRMPLARGTTGRNITMDEICVRANLALENKKFLQDLELTANPAVEGELDSEYNQACAKVDKVTLKLYFTFLQNSKLENAYDLAQRLHLEKSFEIAMEAADRLGFTRLSDRIHDLRESRFPILDVSEDDEQFDDHSTTDLPHSEPQEISRRISPESTTRTKRKDIEEDIDDMEESCPEPATNSNRRINPFAKKLKESPPKTLVESPVPKKPALSRMSTFSAESRQKSKLAKHFL